MPEDSSLTKARQDNDNDKNIKTCYRKLVIYGTTSFMSKHISV